MNALVEQKCDPICSASCKSESQRDFAFVARYVPADEQKRIRGRLKLVSMIFRKVSDAVYLEEGRKIAESFGIDNWSRKSAYRWSKTFDKEHPYTSLIDNRVRRRITAQGIGTNEEFVAFWQQLCLENKRNTAQAYTELFNRLRAGDDIPGVGNWRDVFAAENGGVFPAPDYACPYFPGINVPKGWSERNLRKVQPGAFALTALRKGNMTAAMANLPDVLRTREGLKSCQVVQIDDMWYEQKVAFKGNRHAERVVEYAAMDVLTGRVFARLTKPVIEANDGLKVLKSKWTRYLIAHTLCEVGIPECGCVFQGEHGTATLDTDTIEELHRLTGGLVRFSAGGFFDKPLAAGLSWGRPKGNPKFKGLLEGQHALIKGHLGSAPGQMGGGRGSEPEWVYGMTKEDEALRRWAIVAEKSRPGITSRLRFPFVPFDDFMWLVCKAYHDIDRDVTHHLGQWEECGFVNMFWRANPNALVWEPSSKLLDYPRDVQALMDVTFKANPKLTKLVRMSRLEAWNLRTSDRSWKLDPSVAVKVMGPQLAKTCTVDDKLQLVFKDPETMTQETITGLLEGGGALTRGKSYQVWLNPCSLKAYFCDLKGQFVGVANAVRRANYADDEAVKEQLGARQKVLAQEIEKATPALRRIQAQKSADLAHNLTVMTGEDPAYRTAVETAAAGEIENSEAADIDLGYVDESIESYAGISDDELAAI